MCDRREKFPTFLLPHEIQTALSVEYTRAHDEPELCFSFCTSTGKGTGRYQVPMRLMPQVIAELRSWDLCEGPHQRHHVQERHVCDSSCWDDCTGLHSALAYSPDDQITTFEPVVSDEHGQIAKFYQWWGLGIKPQWVRLEHWEDTVSSIEESYNLLLKKARAVTDDEVMRFPDLSQAAFKKWRTEDVKGN